MKKQTQGLERDTMGAYSPLDAEVEFDADDGVWLSRLAAEPACHTWGRTHAAAIANLADAAALWFGVDDPDAIRFRARTVGLPIDEDQVREARETAEHAAALARDSTAHAARVLTDDGYSRRDVASILGISHQRVQQLLRELPSSA